MEQYKKEIIFISKTILKAPITIASFLITMITIVVSEPTAFYVALTGVSVGLYQDSVYIGFATFGFLYVIGLMSNNIAIAIRALR